MPPKSRQSDVIAHATCSYLVVTSWLLPGSPDWRPRIDAHVILSCTLIYVTSSLSPPRSKRNSLFRWIWSRQSPNTIDALGQSHESDVNAQIMLR